MFWSEFDEKLIFGLEFIYLGFFWTEAKEEADVGIMGPRLRTPKNIVIIYSAKQHVTFVQKTSPCDRLIILEFSMKICIKILQKLPNF